jgi:HK97 family phage major capsid protein
MPATTRTISPDELRARFRAAQRMPQLLECREAVAVALRQVSDEMDASDGGNGDAELAALFASLKGLIDEITARITRAAVVDDIERRSAGVPIGGSGDQQWDRRCTEYRITAAIAGALGPQLGFDIDCGAEREVSQELARRETIKPAGFLVPRAALSLRVRDCPPNLLRSLERRDVISSTTPVGGPGGALIPTFLDPAQFIDPLRAALAVRQLGARVISNLTANLNLPKMTAPAQSAWFAENSPIARSEEQFADVMLRPRHCGAILEISRNMLQQSSPDIEAITRNDLAEVLARAVDSAAVAGAGTTIEPLGIVTDPAVASLPTAAVNYDMMVNLTTILAENNAMTGSLGWLADARVRGYLLQLKDGMQRPYGLDLLFQGFPYAFSNLATSATVPHPIIFMNADDLVIGEWSSIDILVNPYDSDAYSKGNILVRGAMTIDIQKRRVESFAWMGATIAGGTTAAAEAAPPSQPAASERRPR